MDKQEEIRSESLASEIYRDLKKELTVKNWIIGGLIVALVLVCFYHNWLWSQFDTITLDAGGGYSNYVTGENTGGVHNGTGESTPAEGRQG